MSIVRNDWIQELYLKQLCIKENTHGEKSGKIKKPNQGRNKTTRGDSN